MTGAGKDFLATSALKEVSVPIVNWGTLLSRLLGSDRDSMMIDSSPAIVSKMQYEVCDAIIGMQPIAVTAHTVRSRGTSIEFDTKLERYLNPSIYVFVSAPAETIRERVVARNNSCERSSDVLNVCDIHELQILKRDVVRSLADSIGSNFVELSNTRELVLPNTRQLANILSTLVTTSGSSF